MDNVKTQRHADRAMQFAPFAALKGYYECVKMQERITEPKKELSEDEAEIISNTLNQIPIHGLTVLSDTATAAMIR